MTSRTLASVINWCSFVVNRKNVLNVIITTGDELARHLYNYADKESFNTTTKESLMHFASCFAGIQDYRDVEVRYQTICFNVHMFLHREHDELDLYRVCLMY